MLTSEDFITLDHIFLAVTDVDIDWKVPFNQSRAVLFPNGVLPDRLAPADADADAHAWAVLACHEAAALHLLQNAGAVFAEELRQLPASRYDWSFLEREHSEGVLGVRVPGEETYVPVSARLFGELMHLPSPAVDEFGRRVSWPPCPEAEALLASLTARVLGGEQPHHPAEYCLYCGMSGVMGPMPGTPPEPGWPCLDVDLQATLRGTPALMNVIRALVQLPLHQLELLRQGVPNEEIRARALCEIRALFGPDVLSDGAGEAFDDLTEDFLEEEEHKLA